MFNMSNNASSESNFIREKDIISIVDNCGESFKVKLYLTNEVKGLLDFMIDVNIIDVWGIAEEDDIYEI